MATSATTTLLDDLPALTKLQDGWIQGGAKSFSETTIETWTEVLKALPRLPDKFAPLADGRLYIEFIYTKEFPKVEDTRKQSFFLGKLKKLKEPPIQIQNHLCFSLGKEEVSMRFFWNESIREHAIFHAETKDIIRFITSYIKEWDIRVHQGIRPVHLESIQEIVDHNYTEYIKYIQPVWGWKEYINE